MQRDPYKTVMVPILVHCAPEERDGTSGFLPGFQGLRTVRILRGKDLDQKSKFWQSIGPKKLEEFLAVVQLIQAVGKEDSLAARNASVRLAKSKSPELEKVASVIAERFKSYPQTQLDELISERLKRARLVVWNHQGKPVLALYCTDNLTGLFAKVLLERVSGTGLAVCPKCGLPFVQKRPNQDYCSIQHREAHRVARSRARASARKRAKRSRN
jgi:hypothetical protein